MATIQLGPEILAVESLIDDRSHDPAFRQLVLLRDKFGRRPEFRYLQALFDATFEVRSDRELLRDMTALVAEQPDFTEAVALLAFLYDRAGDRVKAEVFAREALRSNNPHALIRARRVLGMEPLPPAIPDSAAAAVARRSAFPTAPPPALEPPGQRALDPAALGAFPPPHLGLGSEPKMQPVYAPQAKPSSPPAPYERHITRALIPSEPEPEPATIPAAMGYPSSEALTTPRRLLTPMPPPPDPFDLQLPPMRSGNSSASDLQPLETINFQPLGGLPPPPSIPPSAIVSPDRIDAPREPQAIIRESPTLPGFALVQVEESPRERSSRSPTPAAVPRTTPQPGFSALGLQEPRLRSQRVEPRTEELTAADLLSPELAVDHTGPESRSTTRSSRPAIAIPPPLEVQRHWFKYARQHQVTTRSAEGAGESTALTLLDFAERVMEGRTPLSAEPVPLDRRGLILVEQILSQFRNSRGTVSAPERAATTSGAAFLLAVLMKEAEARAVDTTPEDGACKAVLPSGASVRPLLIAAAFARGRGPGLVESYDRAATAHMQRSSRSSSNPHRFPSELDTQTGHQPGAIIPGRSATRRAPLSVPRRDLDPGTLCLIEPGAPMGSSPTTHLRGLAEEFWASTEGREVAGSSRRVGTFTLADIDALERHATQAFSLVGLCPPGNPWPWTPNEDQQKQIVIWGAILGEVLNGVYTGRWEIDPTDPQDKQLYRVVLAGSVVAWPMAKVYLRLARGVSHDLSIYVDVVGRIVGRQATRSPNV